MHKLKHVLENETNKILWGLKTKKDNLTQPRRQD